MAIGNFLQIDSISQSESRDDGPRREVNPDEIDPELFTHVSLSGRIPTKSLNWQLLTPRKKILAKSKRQASYDGPFQITIDHYAMLPDAEYLLRVGITLDDTDPAIASIDLETLPHKASAGRKKR